MTINQYATYFVMLRTGEGDCHWPDKATRINGVLASDSHLLIVHNISYFVTSLELYTLMFRCGKPLKAICCYGLVLLL